MVGSDDNSFLFSDGLSIWHLFPLEYVRISHGLDSRNSGSVPSSSVLLLLQRVILGMFLFQFLPEYQLTEIETIVVFWMFWKKQAKKHTSHLKSTFKMQVWF